MQMENDSYLCSVQSAHAKRKNTKEKEVSSLNWGSDPISLRLDEFKMNVQSDRFFFFALLQMYLASQKCLLAHDGRRCRASSTRCGLVARVILSAATSDTPYTWNIQYALFNRAIFAAVCGIAHAVQRCMLLLLHDYNFNAFTVICSRSRAHFWLCSF